MSDSYRTCPTCGHRRQTNPGRDGDNPPCRKCSNATRYSRGPTTNRELHILIDAMTTAESQELAIPCKERPDLWTSNRFASKTANGRALAQELKTACHTCPVLQQCAARRDTAKPGELYGIVAGHLVRRSDRDDGTVTPPVDVPVSAKRVRELRDLGWSPKVIAQRFGVSLNTIKRHLRETKGATA